MIRLIRRLLDLVVYVSKRVVKEIGYVVSGELAKSARRGYCKKNGIMIVNSNDRDNPYKYSTILSCSYWSNPPREEHAYNAKHDCWILKANNSRHAAQLGVYKHYEHLKGGPIYGHVMVCVEMEE